MPDIQLPAFRSGQRLRKPLIEYCTNEWRNTPGYDTPNSPHFVGDTFLDRVEILVDRSIAVIRAPKFRRLLLLLVVMTVSSIVLWTKIIAPFLQEERATWSSLNKHADSAANAGVFGVNIRPRFSDMTHLQTLDRSLVPGLLDERGELSNKKRLVFVGDIHGCREELEQLLKKLKFDPVTDHLIAVGDIVNKGPDSPGVIDLLRGYKASCVRGNHDDRLLLVADELQSNTLESKNKDQQGSEHTQQTSLKADDEERKLAKSLNSEQLAWLKSCPVILRVGQLKAFAGEAVVVHAGLVPGLALDNQDPASVMNMRVIDLATHVPSKKHEREGSVPWYKLWNRYQRLIPARERFARLKSGGKSRAGEGQTTVIYGHDAKLGLQMQKYSKGLDTGCARGGKLTALVVDDTGKQKVVQIGCKDRRKRPPVQVDVDDILQKGKPGPPVGGYVD
ncbi:hypothetical protein A1O3_00109 [Capronia epimyces CBS 606.96]|uniref:Calcineurin-like phosphoesterase domain-containing protein n=1 Tax=Capronia epimyces CBS 606.96 TaxID=1182542 RepID=W9YQM3_9EURO|nr:uncharacterized protein A1O3_00109 [Capronia epimyces CBS 606.96]EXJ91561.1 hypothetical protein A1O3_00109 [Capronia epimyces CBS 606.96]